jgi:quinol monooxygenase YgiN
MKRKRQPQPDDYVLFPDVTHPQGRARAFADAMKAFVRGMIEINGNLTFAYAIDKTDRIVTTDNRHLLSPEEQAEWDAASDEFEAKSPEEQQAWIDNVLSTYPKIDQLPDPDSYNDIN